MAIAFASDKFGSFIANTTLQNMSTLDRDIVYTVAHHGKDLSHNSTSEHVAIGTISTLIPNVANTNSAELLGQLILYPGDTVVFSDVSTLYYQTNSGTVRMSISRGPRDRNWK